MIKANELRIGNWVNIDKCIRKFNISDFEYSNYDISDPIPLTPEILEKCGFAMLRHLGKLQPTLRIDESLEFHWADDALYVTYSEDNYDESIDLGGFTIERPLRHIKHFHQLQNYVYFATNTELTFKS